MPIQATASKNRPASAPASARSCRRWNSSGATTKPTTHRPPAHSATTMDCSASATLRIGQRQRARCRARRDLFSSPITRHPSLDVLDVENLVLFDAARGLHFGGVARVLADEGARGRRADRDLALLDVALVVADDLVGDLLAACGVLELDGRAEHAAAVGVEPRGIDDLAVAELRFQLGDAPLDEALALLRGVILGVLREVAVRARLRDGGDDRRALNRLQLVQLAAEP